jgi:hypothetical protein
LSVSVLRAPPASQAGEKSGDALSVGEFLTTVAKTRDIPILKQAEAEYAMLQ